MEKRTLKNLTVKDENYIFYGDLEIEENLIIENASLIVSGTLIFADSYTNIVVLNNGNISAYSIIGLYPNLKIKNGDIYCHKYLNVNNIFLSGGGHIITNDLYAMKIISDGDIIVNGNAHVVLVSCFNYLVSGINDSYNIIAFQDIYILGTSLSGSLTGRDIFLAEVANLSETNILALRSFEYGVNRSISEWDPVFFL